MSKSTTDKERYIALIKNLALTDTQKSMLEMTWLDYLLLMNKSAKRGWFSHNYSQILVIFLSLLIPVLEPTKLNHDICGLNLKTVSILGLIVAGLTALNRQLGFEEKWRHYRKTAETMRNEGDDFFALAGAYKQFKEHTDACETFLATVTTFKRQEVNAYIEEETRRSVQQQNNKAGRQS